MWQLLTNRRVLQAAALMAVLLVVALWPEAIEVEVASVTRGAMAVMIEGQGDTRVHHRFTVRAPVAALVDVIALAPGNGVELGKTVVAQLTPEPSPPLDAAARAETNKALVAAREALEMARAEEERTREALVLAQSELKREQEQLDAGQTTQQSLEARRNLVGSAEEAVHAAQYDAAAAAAEMEQVRVRLPPRPAPAGRAGAPSRVTDLLAPVDGVVLKRFVESGSAVPAGEPLLEIGDPSHLEIVADLPAADAAKVEPGMRVAVEHWGGDTPLTAWVERVDPTSFTKLSASGAEEQRVNIHIDFEDDRAAWNAMGDGFRVAVRIAIWEAEDAVRVPITALFSGADQWTTYLVQGNRARRVPLVLGERTTTDAEVRKGLTAGQQVIINPPSTLTDNARIVVRQD